jgi:DNA-binding NarL/FixJ family response regulator
MIALRILIVDDHPVVREGLKGLLHSIHISSDIALAANAEEAMELLKKTVFELVITDIHMPGKSGVELAHFIQKEFPSTKVLAMSTFGDRAYVSEMIKNGASGYLSKNSDGETIKDAITRIMNNEVVIGKNLEDTARPIVTHADQPLLTRREKEVLNLIAQGLTNKEIADKIFVSTTTVDSHRKNLLHKFNVMNTAALVAQAAKYQLLD